MSLPPIWDDTFTAYAGMNQNNVTDPTHSIRSIQPLSHTKSTTSTSNNTDLSGTRFAHIGHRPDADYELANVLGSGGMGIVYRAHQHNLKRNVALKLQTNDTHTSTGRQQQFIAEATLTGELDHPHIVPIYEIGHTTGDMLFFSMQEIDGVSWRNYLTDHSVTEHEHWDIFEKVAQTIAYAHDQGVVHCDLKPANIMIGKHGQVFVVDWGLAIRWSADTKRPLTPGGIGGTPAYMAPEQAAHDISRISPATDIYLLGGLLFQLCTGKPPHSAKDSRECLTHALDNILTKHNKNTHPLLACALRALNTQPEKRYATVQALLNDFQAVRHRQAAQEILQKAQTLCQQPSHEHFQHALLLTDEAQRIAPYSDIESTLKELTERYANWAHKQGDWSIVKELLHHNSDHPTFQQACDNLNQQQQRLQRLSSRRKWAAVAGFIGIVLIATSWRYFHLGRQQAEQAVYELVQATEEAQSATEKSRKTTRTALRSQARSALTLAHDHTIIGDTAEAQTLLHSIHPDEREWGWRYLHRRSLHWGLALYTPGLTAYQIATDDSGKYIFVGNVEGLYVYHQERAEPVRFFAIGFTPWIAYKDDTVYCGSKQGVWKINNWLHNEPELIHQLHQGAPSFGTITENNAILTGSKKK